MAHSPGVDFTYLTATQAAERADVSRRTITRWVSSGRLTPALKLPTVTGNLLFRPEDVDAAREQVTA